MGAGLNDFQTFRNFCIDCGEAQIYLINDNDGNDFTFRKLNGQDFWMVEEAFQAALDDLPRIEQRRIAAPAYDAACQPLVRALAAIVTTDVLAAGIDSVSVGLRLNPACAESRAAWYSFGFLLRRAAAVSLDVSESEIDLGIQPVMDFTSPFAPPSARIFISDSLENGAGYSTFLGEPHRFEELLHFMLGEMSPSWASHLPVDSFHSPLVDAAHEVECVNSCHRCLREFGNMAFHALLDWRLGLDMVRLALDHHAAIDLTYPYWSSLLSRIAIPYFDGLNLAPQLFAGLHGGVNAYTGEAVILIHPLWDTNQANFRPDLAAAVAEVEQQGLTPVFCSVFHAARFPYE